VYRRQKHPFLSPPATLNQDGRLNEILQDTLRGPLMDSLPFFDRRKVTGLLDSIPKMDDGARTAIDQPLMLMLSACALQDRYQPTS
jgi:asparagine synthase (glutamine-hydrolysing)